MKWVTRAKARVDRIACPWLISRFIDREAVFLFVPDERVGQVAEAEGAIPFDVPGAALGHHGPRCSFDAFLDTYELTDPALQALAVIVRGADTEARHLAPESPGLYALASGFREIARDDHENMARQFPAYDALYAHCRARIASGSLTAGVVLFVCLHGAAKSVVAAAHFQRRADERGRPFRAAFAGVEPEADIAPKVVSELLAEGIDVRGRHPRQVTAADLTSALHVVSFGCDLAHLAPDVAIESWRDIPAVSDGYPQARAAIHERVDRLLATLSA